MCVESLDTKLASVCSLDRPSHYSELRMDRFISLALAKDTDKTASALKRTEMKPIRRRKQADWL